MKIGLSSYSLFREIKSGSMTIIDAIRWVAAEGGKHIEIVPVGFDIAQDSDLPERIREEARQAQIDVSNYAIGANFIVENEQKLRDEVDRVKRQVDIASRLGVKLMRHDVASRPIAEATLTNYIKDLGLLVEVCQEIADYAAQYDIVTSIENHGYYIQGSNRVITLVEQVNRPNFRTTLDVGNFLCVDENPLDAIKRSLPYASIVHLKDFYLRPAHRNPGDGWFPTASGNYLRGAVLGQGDIDLYEVLRLIKQSGYSGYFSVEFEGLEECKWGSKTSMENAVRIWNE
ncbi:sugar phosphate isomerase/epimerase [Paenibacillus albiflavus]|uniref:Sugar phosphate isomerase/epimerase n=1 Tax=Paenibacillus albiflavus TaxID=2545760 RepID=A0A4R4E9P3_9BACL|nr:sugar phosphate isomerase/epimerase family protein [Paenibacillus albiflavus]TCZ76576.1 sugar phosphate isomerase/epimerase [Paenibacillus albiflavus]